MTADLLAKYLYRLGRGVEMKTEANRPVVVRPAVTVIPAKAGI